MVADERWHAVWEHREAAVRAARRYAPSAEDAEDAVMDAIIRCASHPDLDADRAAAFPMVVTRNTCADIARARRRRESPRYVHAHASDATAGGFEDTVCAAAEARWLATCLSRLPARERAVVAGRAAGRSDRELALDLAVSPRAVESALTRARRKLKGWAADESVRGR